MSKKNVKGEMPFLDHLEELRWRILRSLAALVVGTIIGFLVVQNFEVLELLKEPIAPYLPNNKLHVTAPTDAFFVTLQLAFAIGLVLAAPVIISQVWGFLNPALYEHERRYIVPFMIAGLGLFIAGVLMGYLWVLPVAMKFLITKFQAEYLEFIITATAYFGFVTRLLLAFGIMFEVPVLMVLLSVMGLVSPKTFAKWRPYALVVASILSAMLTPPDIASMLGLMFPVVFLYEVGILVSKIAWKDRTRREAAG